MRRRRSMLRQLCQLNETAEVGRRYESCLSHANLHASRPFPEDFARVWRRVGLRAAGCRENKFTPQQDVELGRKGAAEVRQQYPVVQDERIAAYLTKLVRSFR